MDSGGAGVGSLGMAGSGIIPSSVGSWVESRNSAISRSMLPSFVGKGAASLVGCSALRLEVEEEEGAPLSQVPMLVLSCRSRSERTSASPSSINWSICGVGGREIGKGVEGLLRRRGVWFEVDAAPEADISST